MVSGDPSTRESAADVFAAIGYLMEPISSGAAVNVPRKKRRISNCFASVRAFPHVQAKKHRELARSASV